MTELGSPEPAPSPAPEGPPDEPSPGGRNLPIAIASGLALAGLMLGSIFWHPLAFTLLVLVLCLLGVVEAARVMASQAVGVSVAVLIVTALVTLLGTYHAGAAGQGIGVLVLFLGAVAWQLADGRRTDVFRTIAATVMFGLWVPFLASYAVLLITRPDGAWAAVAVLGGAIFTDIGGYAFGSRFGRHKIAPTVSPAKSWEGLVGGLVTAGLIGALVLPPADGFAVWTAVAIPVIAGVAGFVGDLTESMIKRDLGVKDLGALIPGHGGVLDRVDGILLAMPVGYYALELLR